MSLGHILPCVRYLQKNTRPLSFCSELKVFPRVFPINEADGIEKLVGYKSRQNVTPVFVIFTNLTFSVFLCTFDPVARHENMDTSC